MQNRLSQKNSFFAALLMLVVLVASVQVTSVSANPGVAKLIAQRIEDTNLTAGSTFSININVSDVSDLWGFQFVLYFDPTMLSATGFLVFDPFTDASPSEINNTAGLAAIAYSMPFGITQGGGFFTVEPKPIAKIDFTVKGIGVSLLELRDTLLVTPMARAIEHKVVDGHFSNIAAKASVSPQITHERVGNTFHINITLTKIEKVYAYDFVLIYNTTILNATDFISYDPFTVERSASINETAGNVIMNYSMPTNDGFSAVDPVPVAGIDFVVDEVGSSPLDLQDATITDTDGKSIDIQAIGGIFSNVRDVAVVNVKAFQSLVSPGELVYINVTAANVGDTDETFNVVARYTNLTVENAFSSTTVSLESGDTTIIVLSWDTTGLSEGIYNIEAEAILDSDINTANNLISSITTVRVRGPPLGPVVYLYALAVGVFGAFGVAATVSSYRSRKRRQRTAFVRPTP